MMIINSCMTVEFQALIGILGTFYNQYWMLRSHSFQALIGILGTFKHHNTTKT